LGCGDQTAGREARDRLRGRGGGGAYYGGVAVLELALEPDGLPLVRQHLCVRVRGRV
jgi:hypothetical protein